jgi:imidazoleglycerol phosphate dehydratase HisB
MRKSEITRKTSETEISLSLNIDGTGQSVIETGVGFFDHMLTLFAWAKPLPRRWAAKSAFPVTAV